MGIGNWFRRRAGRRAEERPRASGPLGWLPSASSVVEFDDQSVTCRRPSGKVETVRWDELRAVLVMTTSGGPFVDDVFWVLAGENGGCVVPSEAAGCDKLLQRLQRLPGFDNSAVIEAMSCTEDRQFLCWEKTA